MKSTSQPLRGIAQKFSQQLARPLVERLARRSGFIHRARKCSGFAFVLSFFLCLHQRAFSLRQWALQFTALSGEAFSKQALDKRLCQKASGFCRALLEQLLRQRLRRSGLLKGFARVVVQDSTLFPLSEGLAPAFRGTVSQGVQKAALRLQVILEVCRLQLLHFALSPYSCNDQSAASMLHPHVRKGTLVLRDLGYFSLDSLKKITQRGAYVITRLHFRVGLYDGQGKALALNAVLKHRLCCRLVQVGQQAQLPLRLVVLPVAQKVAERRVRQARKNHDGRFHYSKAYYRYLRYDVFLTNTTCSPQQVKALYGLRWQVELYFKALKSGALHLSELLAPVKTNARRIEVVVLLALCFVVLITPHYQDFTQALQAGEGGYLSFVKVLDWMVQNLLLVLLLPVPTLKALLQQHCCYEKRKRKNLPQKIHSLS